MNLNVIVRGQSNAFSMMESNGRAGVRDLTAEVTRWLGFNGTSDTVTLIYDPGNRSDGTVFGGTSLIGDWLFGSPASWSVGSLERALLTEIGGLPANLRDDPTATLWFHSEFDSRDENLSAETWVSAVRFDAVQVRAALGQAAGTTPYLFVSAMPYVNGSDRGHQAIREGMEVLARDLSFNAHVAARILDIDAAADDYDGNPATREYGGEHLDGGDATQVIARAARSIAEAFATYAKPGSLLAQAGGNIANDGPEVIRAEQLAATSQVYIDVRHDKAGGFAPLDPDAAAGTGWSVIASNVSVAASAVQIVDSDTLLLTFSDGLPGGGELFYGHGYGRLAADNAAGRGNAVYDDQGLPIWVRADGLAITGVAPGSGPPPSPTPKPDAMCILTDTESLVGANVALMGFGAGAGAGGWASDDRYPRHLADVNDDGRADIVGFAEAGVLVSLANGTGGFGGMTLGLAAFGAGAGAGGWASDDRYPRHLADVNGDGRADIVGFAEAGVLVSLANATGGFGGMTLGLAAFGAGAGAGGWASDDRYPRHLADVNGDGRADIVGFGEAGVLVSLANGTGGFGGMTLGLAAFGAGAGAGGWASDDRYPRHLADVNGDGRADIVGFGEAGVLVSLANGTGGFGGMTLELAAFGAGAGAGGWASDDRYPRHLADVNDDGRADIVGFAEAGVLVSLANGTGGFGGMTLGLAAFGAGAGAGGWASDDRYPRHLADVNGDGRADIVGFAEAGVLVAQSGGVWG